MPSLAEVSAYRRAQAAVSAAAQGRLSAFWRTLNTSDVVAVRTALETFYPALVEQFGSASVAVSAEWFESLTGVPARVGASVPEAAANARMRWGIGSILQGNPAGALLALHVLTDELVKQPGRNTIADSSASAGLKYARVPTGAETCGWCLVLASRGAVYETAQTAGDYRKYHGACDCVAAPIRDESDLPKGYDPDALYEKYIAASPSGSIKTIAARLDAGP